MMKMSVLMKTILATLDTSRGIVKGIRMVRRHHLLRPVNTRSADILGIIHGSSSNDSITAMPYGSSRNNSILSLGDSHHIGSSSSLLFHEYSAYPVADIGRDGYSSETCLLDDESWEI